MTNPVMSVRQTRNGTTEEPLGRWCMTWCPACDDLHRFIITNEDGSTPSGPVWGWDGNLEAPTFEGSMLVRGGPQGTDFVCHSFLKEGVWEFLGDCTHDKANQQVAMVPLPDWLVKEA